MRISSFVPLASFASIRDSKNRQKQERGACGYDPISGACS
jgi:hypothetical protein